MNLRHSENDSRTQLDSALQPDLPPQEQTQHREYWLGLDAAHPSAFDAARDADATHEGHRHLDRRGFLSLMAASAALAGLQGCRRPEIEILPYARMPEFVTPGLPLFYATSLVSAGGVRPVLVETHEGRPTKIEGHPDHPFSQGATDLITQANILELYDPDRSRIVRHEGRESSQESFDAFSASHFAALFEKEGEGLSILGESQLLNSMPSLRMLRQHLRETAGNATWHEYSPGDDQHQKLATEWVFGRPLSVRYRFDRAKVVVSFDADFLGAGEHHALAYTREFVAARQAGNSFLEMSRLYVAEPTQTITGGMADHRLRLPRTEVLDFVISLARTLGIDGELVEDVASARKSTRKSANALDAWVREVAADLRDNAGCGIVVAGSAQPPVVHAILYLINEMLGNLNTTVTFRSRQDEGVLDLRSLVDRIDGGHVDTLIILGGNPAYDAPVDFQFADKLKQIPTTIRFGLYEDETSQFCKWHIPAAHTFESWADAETPDGDFSSVQPLIAPLFGGRSLLEFVARLCGYELTEPYEIAKRAFTERMKQTSASATFDRFLHDGFSPGVQADFEEVEVDREQIVTQLPKLLSDQDAGGTEDSNFEVTFHLDSSVFDGRFANNGWLQEVPDPITKLTWDNAALISPDAAQRVGLSSGDIVRLIVENRSLEIPVWVAPGQADRTISVALGYGRTHAGQVGNRVGFDAYVLRTSDSPFVVKGVRIEQTGGVHDFACTQSQWGLEGRDLVREYPLTMLLGLDEKSNEAPHRGDTHGPSNEHAPGVDPGHSAANGTDHHELPLIESPSLTGNHQWGMTIDLNRCVGCNACMVACQSENNIPIVGKGEVANGRSMHWIRVDRYFRGDERDPSMIHQPVACVHCEKAPCETVCPVNAAVHSPEGLNLQVYNRCVGTRYCSNNCPYKVRRFNWFDYQQRPLDNLRMGPLTSKGSPETRKMQRNPDVSVRMRGIMEKCTYCVQRIERAKTGVKLSDPTAREFQVPDGMITPACAQACPAQAIVFGDVSDATSKVSQQKRDARHFGLLAELGTTPRTTYLARIKNPNLRLQQALSSEGNLPT